MNRRDMLGLSAAMAAAWLGIKGFARRRLTLSRDYASASGYTPIRIEGVRRQKSVRVWFGDVEATDVEYDGEHCITCTVPPFPGHVSPLGTKVRLGVNDDAEAAFVYYPAYVTAYGESVPPFSVQ